MNEFIFRKAFMNDVAEDDLEPLIILYLPPKYWDSRPGPASLAFAMLKVEVRAFLHRQPFYQVSHILGPGPVI